MITTYDIHEFQDKLPEIASILKRSGGHYVVTQSNKPSMVAISYREFAELSEIAQELGSSKLKRDVQIARKEYKSGKTTDFRDCIDR